MCVVAVAIEAHPRWRLVAAGNRDEYHARASAPLAAWNDGSGIIAGRDLVSGGSWMGVSESGRFAVVTNIRDADGPDPAKRSRGALVADWLARGELPEDAGGFNPFSLIAADDSNAYHLSNRPTAQKHILGKGVHGLSNAIPDEHWPRKDRLIDEMTAWLARTPDDPHLLLNLLRDNSPPDSGSHPLFIKSPVYGTRCSTIVTVDYMGNGKIIEHRFDASGAPCGQTALEFRWPAEFATN